MGRTFSNCGDARLYGGFYVQPIACQLQQKYTSLRTHTFVVIKATLYLIDNWNNVPF